MRQRRLPLLLAAALAAAPLAAQKPGADDAERERYRGQGIAMCVAELSGVAGFTPDDLEAVCGCAFERVMAGHETAALPSLRPGRMETRLAGPMIACAAERRPALGAAVARHVTAMPAPAIAPPVVTPSTPEPDKPAPAPAPAAGPGFDPSAWLDGLSLPGSGRVPRWAWIPLAVLALALLRLFFRRRDGDRDLDGPPSRIRPRR